MKPSGIEPLFSPWKGDVLPIDEGSYKIIKGARGIEPRAYGLTVRRSTAELHPRWLMQCLEKGSHLRLMDFQSTTLLLSYLSQIWRKLGTQRFVSHI